jgi:hypothetical protein
MYSVWVGGVEVNDYYLNEAEALDSAKYWVEDGYDDVMIDFLED